MSNNNKNNFKSLYQDGVAPGLEYSHIQDDVNQSLEKIFEKYIKAGYSPREISALIHSCTAVIGAKQAMIIIVKETKSSKKTLTDPPEKV